VLDGSLGKDSWFLRRHLTGRWGLFPLLFRKASKPGKEGDCDVCMQHQLGVIRQASREERKEGDGDDGIRNRLGLIHEVSRKEGKEVDGDDGIRCHLGLIHVVSRYPPAS
jgi:hypothetical protein